MDAFRELTPEEIKLATLQFLGQHLTGELRELDKNIVSKNQTLQGYSIDPVRVIKTIPTNQQATSLPPPPPVATTVNAGINVQPSPIQASVFEAKPQPVDYSQILTFLKRIEDKLDALINKS